MAAHAAAASSLRFVSILACVVALSPAAAAAEECPPEGMFGFPAFTFSGSGGYEIAAADLNADGLLDVAIASYGSGLLVRLGVPAGHPSVPALGPAVSYGGQRGANGLTIGDFDADGIQDIAVGSRELGVCVYRGLGANGIGNGQFSISQSFEIGICWDVAAGDVNGDGAIDLVAGGYDSVFWVLLGQRTATGHPTGVFAAPIAKATDGHLKGIKLADLNRDGALDLVASTELNWIVVNKGLRGPAGPNGGFGPPLRFFLAGETFDVVVADFDGDTNQDIASANYTYRSASVLLGNGQLGFSAPINHPLSTEDFGVAVGDLDRDGRPDLLATSWTRGFSFLLNKGASVQYPDGLRPAALVAPTYWYSYSLAIADFTQDGALDVAVCSDYQGVLICANTCGVDVPVPAVASLVSASTYRDRIELVWYSPASPTAAWVQRSEDAAAWADLGPASLDGSGFMRYTDRNAPSGRALHYRLRIQTGEVDAFTDPIRVETMASDLWLTVQPNGGDLARGVEISYSLSGSGAARLDLFDLVGRRRWTRPLKPDEVAGRLELSTSADLPPGVYWIRLEQGGLYRTARAVLLN